MTRLVFLHGVGSSGAALRPVAQALGLDFPAHFPDGTDPSDMGPGRQWFSVKAVTEANRPARIAGALPALRATVESFGDPAETVLVGFSQGAIMALHAVAAGMPAKAVFALSGRLAGPIPARADWPEIHLLHGAEDGVITPDFAQATEGWLRAAGAAPRLRIFAALGHSIDARTLAAMREALA